MRLWFWVVSFVGILSEQQRWVVELLLEENRVLREHLLVELEGRRLLLGQRDKVRLAVIAERLGRTGLAGLTLTFSPDTLLRWYQALVAKKYDGSARRGKGWPPISEDLVFLIVKLAKENETWGYRRICGALANLGFVVSASTVRRVLEDFGLPPTPKRKQEVSWSGFIKRHFEVLAATDFISVEILSKFELVRYQVLFVIDLATRRVEITGVVREPNGLWMAQKARELTDDFDGFLLGKKYLLSDRGSVFTKRFESILATGGVTLKRIPPRSPNLNAYAERFVRSIKEECLSRVIILGERHLEKLLKDYVSHYHLERNHQGMENKLLTEQILSRDGPIKCRQRQGGLLKYYYRDAA